MSRRRLTAVGIVVAAAVCAGVAFATIPSATGVIDACWQKSTGALRVVDPDSGTPRPCTSQEAPLTWNQEGVPGADGEDGEDGEDFAGTFESPNGLYSLSVTNSGIELSGPAGTITIGGTKIEVDATSNAEITSGGSVELKSGASLDVDAGAIGIDSSGPIDIQGSGTIDIEGAGTVGVAGASLNLNGGGPSVARRGDAVVGGVITGGSATVTAG